MPGKGSLVRSLLVFTVLTAAPTCTMMAGALTFPRATPATGATSVPTATPSALLGGTSVVLGPTSLVLGARPAEAAALRIGQPAPDIAGGPWINSEPLTLQGLRGRVVLVEFWTYG
jgi:hypothetical protein